MIPIMIPASDTTAKYTLLLKELSASLKQSLQDILDDFDNTDSLYQHFYNMYRLNEISTKENSGYEFVQQVEAVYNEHCDYYKELLAAYKKNVNLDDITKKLSNRTDTNTGTTVNSGSSSSDTTNKEYDLPNKSINPTDENGYLTGKSTNSNSGSASNSENRMSTYTSANNSTDNRDYLRLKREYLSQIRDIYEEFAREFYDCFLHIY